MESNLTLVRWEVPKLVARFNDRFIGWMNLSPAPTLRSINHLASRLVIDSPSLKICRVYGFSVAGGGARPKYTSFEGIYYYCCSLHSCEPCLSETALSLPTVAALFWRARSPSAASQYKNNEIEQTWSDDSADFLSSLLTHGDWNISASLLSVTNAVTNFHRFLSSPSLIGDFNECIYIKTALVAVRDRSLCFANDSIYETIFSAVFFSILSEI